MDLKRQVTVEIDGQEVHLDVNMRVIEIIERVYNCNVNFAVVSLQNPAQVKLTDLADVYGAWLTNGHLEQLEISRKDLRRWVYQADIDTINRLSGAVMGAALHYRHDISGDDMQTLASGRSLEGPTDDEKKPSSEAEQPETSTK